MISRTGHRAVEACRRDHPWRFFASAVPSLRRRRTSSAGVGLPWLWVARPADRRFQSAPSLRNNARRQSPVGGCVSRYQTGDRRPCSPASLPTGWISSPARPVAAASPDLKLRGCRPPGEGWSTDACSLVVSLVVLAVASATAKTVSAQDTGRLRPACERPWFLDARNLPGASRCAGAVWRSGHDFLLRRSRPSPPLAPAQQLTARRTCCGRVKRPVSLKLSR